MKSKLKDIKEFVILLDNLEKIVRNQAITDSHQEKEMAQVLDILKKYVEMGIVQDLEKIEEIVIITDTVNGFMKDGPLANPTAMHIVPNQIELIERILERNGLLIFVNDWHDRNCVEFKDFPPHCEMDTWEARVIDELKPYEPYAITIEKNSTSFMFARGFVNLMRLLKNLKRVYDTGVCSDICLPNGTIPLKNFFNQINRDVEIIIPENCVETFNAPNHNRDEYWHASKILMRQSGIKLVKTINDIDWRK